MNKNIAIVLICLLLVFVGVFWLLQDNGSGEQNVLEEQRGIAGEPLDIVLDFYTSWLDARKSTSTDPYNQQLQSQEVLGVELSRKLTDAENVFRTDGIDMVLCREPIPEKIRAKTVFENDTSAQFLILSEKKSDGYIYAVVTLRGLDGIWEINDINCNASEEAPEQGEFNFDKEGYLLKEHVPPPYNSENWHLIFKQDGVDGHAVPLLLSDTTVCTDSSSEKTCEDSMLYEAAHIHLQGQMTEGGVDAVRIEFIE